MKRKWEYHVELDADLSPWYIERTLKQLGDDGWEMMSCVKRHTFAGVDKYTIVFKREKQ